MSDEHSGVIAESPGHDDVGAAIGLEADTKRDDRPPVYPDSTLVLVGCGKAKRDPDDPVDLHAAAIEESEELPGASNVETGPYWRAEDLYTSTYFQVKREFAEAVTRWDGDPDGTPWAILSAEHKILFPWETIAPYDTTIDDLGDDPLTPEDRVNSSFGRLRPDGTEIVTEMDQWATGVAYGLARWLAMFRDRRDHPHTSRASTLLVLAGQSYVEPLRERGVFTYGISRMAGDPNDIHELPVHVRFPFEEIDAGGIGEQMAWMSEAIEALEGPADETEQTALTDGGVGR